MGKTSLALNIATHVAVQLRKTVGVFSLEMGQQELAMRILCSRANVRYSARARRATSRSSSGPRSSRP